MPPVTPTMASTMPAVMPKNQCSWKIALRKVMVRGRSGFRPAAQEVVVDPGELQQCGAVGIGLGQGLDRGVELEQPPPLGVIPARKLVVKGKSVSVRVDLGGRRLIKKKNVITDQG